MNGGVSSNVLLLTAILILTVLEVGAVLAVIIWAPTGQQTTLIATLVGIVGPIVASLIAVWRAETAHNTVQQIASTNAAAPTDTAWSKTS